MGHYGTVSYPKPWSTKDLLSSFFFKLKVAGENACDILVLFYNTYMHKQIQHIQKPSHILFCLL